MNVCFIRATLGYKHASQDYIASRLRLLHLAGVSRSVSYIVLGEPASKANSRKLVRFGGRPAFIKSDKARTYAANFLTQVPVLDPMLEGELRADITIYYASQRPDLDESLILDLLQGRVYANDRQVRERHVYHRIDRTNPRCEITISPRS